MVEPLTLEKMVEIIIALSALIVSFVALKYTKGYNQKKDTLEGFNRLQREVLDHLNGYSEKQINEIVTKNEHKEITEFLARIEHFAVGVNTGIYRIGIIKRLAGKYFIGLYAKLESVIKYKRAIKPEAKHYDEFEILVEKLKRLYRRDDAIKRMKEKLKTNSRLTIPVWLYIVLLIIGISLVIAGTISKSCEVAADIATGIGCSIIAGIIVAVFTDKSATKIKYKKDNEQYKIQIRELKRECEYLPCVVCVSVCNHCEDLLSERKSFKKWCEELFDLSKVVAVEIAESEIEYCMETIREIRRKCAGLQVLVLNNLDNQNYDLKFIGKLKKLENKSDRLIRMQYRKKYEGYDRMLNEFTDVVVDLFPELKNDYANKYNAESYEE